MFKICLKYIKRYLFLKNVYEGIINNLGPQSAISHMRRQRVIVVKYNAVSFTRET